MKKILLSLVTMVVKFYLSNCETKLNKWTHVTLTKYQNIVTSGTVSNAINTTLIYMDQMYILFLQMTSLIIHIYYLQKAPGLDK